MGPGPPTPRSGRYLRGEGGSGCPPPVGAGCPKCVYAPYRTLGTCMPGSKGSRHVGQAEVLGWLAQGRPLPEARTGMRINLLTKVKRLIVMAEQVLVLLTGQKYMGDSHGESLPEVD